MGEAQEESIRDIINWWSNQPCKSLGKNMGSTLEQISIEIHKQLANIVRIKKTLTRIIKDMMNIVLHAM